MTYKVSWSDSSSVIGGFNAVVSDCLYVIVAEVIGLSVVEVVLISSDCSHNRGWVRHLEMPRWRFKTSSLPVRSMLIAAWFSHLCDICGPFVQQTCRIIDLLPQAAFCVQFFIYCTVQKLLPYEGKPCCPTETALQPLQYDKLRTISAYNLLSPPQDQCFSER